MKLPVVGEAWPETLGLLIVCGLLAGLVVTACGAWPWVSAWLNSSNASGWVQAIGSIGAIIGTMWAARHQVTKQAAEQERVRLQVEREKLVKAFRIYSELCDTAHDVIRQFSGHYKDPVVTANINHFVAPLAASLRGLEVGLSGHLLDDLPTELVVIKASVLVVLADLRASLEQVRVEHELLQASKQAPPDRPIAAGISGIPGEQPRTLVLALLDARIRTALTFFAEQERAKRSATARSIFPPAAPSDPR